MTIYETGITLVEPLMDWAMLIYIVHFGWWELPIFSDAAMCVKALNELLARAPDLLIVCSPSGMEI